MTQYYLSFNGTTSFVDVGTDSSLEDLADAAMTVEAWIYLDSLSTCYIASKRSTGGVGGWALYYNNSAGNGIQAWIDCSIADANSKYGSLLSISTWYHIAFTWDDASYTIPRLWVNGVESSNSVAARNGAIVTDVGNNLNIARYNGDSLYVPGDIAWVRISDTVRWTSDFTPAAKDAPPTIDGNTVEQWNFNDGSGATATAEVDGNNDGTITDYDWEQLGQTHALAGDSLVVNPAVEDTSIGQTHELVPVGIIATTVVGAPTVSQEYALVAVGVVTTPVIEDTSIGQTHELIPGTTIVLPVVGISSIQPNRSLSRRPPAPGVSSITQTHSLISVGITTTSVVGTPSASPIYALVAYGITVSPEVDTVSITQAHILIALGLSASSVVGTPGRVLVGSLMGIVFTVHSPRGIL